WQHEVAVDVAPLRLCALPTLDAAAVGGDGDLRLIHAERAGEHYRVFLIELARLSIAHRETFRRGSGHEDLALGAVRPTAAPLAAFQARACRLARWCGGERRDRSRRGRRDVARTYRSMRGWSFRAGRIRPVRRAAGEERHGAAYCNQRSQQEHQRATGPLARSLGEAARTWRGHRAKSSGRLAGVTRKWRNPRSGFVGRS